MQMTKYLNLLILGVMMMPQFTNAQDAPRARDLQIPFSGTPGQQNAITDVEGVKVGHATLIRGEGKLEVGVGPVRTGVTAILPRGKKYDPVFAGWYSLNGNGEMTGTTWVEESFPTPIVLVLFVMQWSSGDTRINILTHCLTPLMFTGRCR